jgi:hypothetical protein
VRSGIVGSLSQTDKVMSCRICDRNGSGMNRTSQTPRANRCRSDQGFPPAARLAAGPAFCSHQFFHFATEAFRSVVPKSGA